MKEIDELIIRAKVSLDSKIQQLAEAAEKRLNAEMRERLNKERESARKWWGVMVDRPVPFVLCGLVGFVLGLLVMFGVTPRHA